MTPSHATSTIIPPPPPPPVNLSCTYKVRFARRFLRSLSKMSKTRPSSSICVKKRSEGLKMAAYWCMARAVGSRKAWSRAILMKLSRGRQHPHHFSMKRRMRGKSGSSCRLLGEIKKAKRKGKITNCSPSPHDEDDEDRLMKRQTEKLREVVPGGKLMDICSLLEETAHFVTCLAAKCHGLSNLRDGSSVRPSKLCSTQAWILLVSLPKTKLSWEN